MTISTVYVKTWSTKGSNPVRLYKLSGELVRRNHSTGIKSQGNIYKGWKRCGKWGKKRAVRLME